MIAVPASGRTGDRQPSTDPYHRPSTANSFRSPKSGNQNISRNSTPSVSPLSTTSRTYNNSAIASENAVRFLQNGMASRGQNSAAPLDDQDDDTRSSSLSDIDVDLDDQMAADNVSLSSQLQEPENESEAETERLGRTPQKPRRTAETVRTPSRLHHQRSTHEDDELSDVDSTPPALPRGSVSPTASRHTKELAGRKRKRSGTLSDADSSLSEESESDQAQGKRRSSQKSSKPALWTDSAQNGALDLAAEVADEKADIEDEAPLVETVESPAISPSRGTRKGKGRSRSKPQKEVVEAVKFAEEKAIQEAREQEEQVEEEEEDSKTELSAEEVEKREQASKLFENLYDQFKALRKTLQSERLAMAENELAQLTQDYPNHPDYLAQLQAVTLRRDTKIRQEMKLHHYKKQALRNETLGNRSQLLSQYLQEAREIREETLYDLGKQWYDIQKERRATQADELEQYTYNFPTKRSEQVRQQTKYNREVSILSGVAKHVGFPAAPEIEGVRSREMDDDFKAMKISRRQPHTLTYGGPEFQPRMPAPPIPTSEHIAQKEFLEQTPWANPHHPVHRTPSAFGPQHLGWQSSAQQSAFAHPPGQSTRVGSPYSTPIAGGHRNTDDEPNAPGSNETLGLPSDPPSSVMAAPPTADRIQLIPFNRPGEGSPTIQRKRQPGNKRDFSGLSSTSTIDAPSDPAHADGPSVATLPTDTSAPNQAFATSAIHAQRGDARQPEVYETVDYRRTGNFGTPLPFGGGGSGISIGPGADVR